MMRTMTEYVMPLWLVLLIIAAVTAIVFSIIILANYLNERRNKK